MDVPDHFFDEFEEDLSDPVCVQQIYDFALTQVRGMVDYNDEDDVIQEVFVRLTKWPIGRKYNSKRHYFSLLKITIRQAIAAYWRRWHSQRNDVSKRKFISDLQAADSKRYEFSGKAENVLYRLQVKELVQKLLARVESLDECQRQMFRLRFLQEQSHETIAAKLGMSIRTSYRLEARLRQMLREFAQIHED